MTGEDLGSLPVWIVNPQSPSVGESEWRSRRTGRVHRPCGRGG